jgi:hypothetical protein
MMLLWESVNIMFILPQSTNMYPREILATSLALASFRSYLQLSRVPLTAFAIKSSSQLVDVSCSGPIFLNGSLL